MRAGWRLEWFRHQTRNPSMDGPSKLHSRKRLLLRCLCGSNSLLGGSFAVVLIVSPLFLAVTAAASSPFLQPQSTVRKLWRSWDNNSPLWKDNAIILDGAMIPLWNDLMLKSETAGQPVSNSNLDGTEMQERTFLAALADFVGGLLPTQNQVVTLFLTVLLFREYWSRVPFWLQNLLLYPWRKLVLAPIRRWQRQWRLQKMAHSNTSDTAAVASSGITTNSGNISPLSTMPLDAASPTESPSSVGEQDTNGLFFEDDDTNDLDGDGLDDRDYGSGLLGKLNKILTFVASATHSTLAELTNSSSFNTPFALEVTFLVMLQMVRQCRRATSQKWDDFYAASGTPLLAVSSSLAPTGDTVQAARDTSASNQPSSASREKVIRPLIDYLGFSDWAYFEETSQIQAKLTELNNNSSIAANSADGGDVLNVEKDATTASSVPTEPSAASWHLLRHAKTNEPTRVSHFIAMDSQRKVVVIAVKGTSALSDMVTDACGVAVRYTMTHSKSSSSNVTSSVGALSHTDDMAGTTLTATTESSTTDKDTSSSAAKLISCHQGVLEASLALVDDLQPLIEHLFLPAGYRIVLVGHSLGAGCACMAGILLRERIPALQSPRNVPTTGNSEQLPLEVVAFAPPPILNREAAMATTSFITSIVHNDDMIPRSSVSNLVSLLRFLSIVNTRLDEKGLRPQGLGGAVRLLKMVLGGGVDVDGDGKPDTIMTAEEIFAGLNKARSTDDFTIAADGECSSNETSVLEDMDHLFVPGKVIVIYEKHVLPEALPVVDANVSSSSNENGAAASVAAELISSDSTTNTTLTTETTSPKKSLVEEMRNFISDLLPVRETTNSTGQPATTASGTIAEVDAIVANGLTPVLRHIIVNDRMVSDHAVVAYEKTLRALLLAPATTNIATATPANA
jgi:Lipase (class 3)